MRILALETSLIEGSIALLQDGTLVRYDELDRSMRTARSLAPAIANALAETDWKTSDVDLVAVSQGPGSFTGLRVGITTAKLFAYAASAAVIGVNTLEVIAAQSANGLEPLHVVMDAQRNQLFAARYRKGKEGMWVAEQPIQIVDMDVWLHGLTAGMQISGRGLCKIRDRLPGSVQVAPEEDWTPRASTVGAVGHRLYSAGRQDDIWKLKPSYYRKSAAEEKLESREAD